MAQPCGFAGFSKVGKKWAQGGQSGQKTDQNVLTTSSNFSQHFSKNPLCPLSAHFQNQKWAKNFH
jgi:hypothetical protein